MKEKLILSFIILISISIFGIFIFNKFLHIKLIATLFLMIAVYTQYYLSKKNINIFTAPRGTKPPKNASRGDLFIEYK
ncbi:MAG: hypothetical protein WC494_04225 [Candidatus Pacearchaeota archaeon]